MVFSKNKKPKQKLSKSILGSGLLDRVLSDCRVNKHITAETLHTEITTLLANWKYLPVFGIPRGSKVASSCTVSITKGRYWED